MLARGQGAPADAAEANVAFEKGCDRGDERCCALSASYAATKEFGQLLRPVRLVSKQNLT